MQLIAIRNILVFLFVACFFFYPRLQTLFISLAFFLTFFTGEFYEFKNRVLQNQISWVFIAFFTLGLVSLLWTDNMAAGWKGIEIKFSFIAFAIFLPLIFNVKSFNFSRVINVLTISSLVYVALSFGRAIYIYSETGNFSTLLGSTLGFRMFQDAPFVHPTYVSFYFLTLILIWGKNLIEGGKELFTSSIIGKVSLLLAFFVFVFFSSSKAGLLGMGIVVVMLLALFAKREKKTIQAIGFFVFFLIVMVVGIYNTNLKLKFEQAYIELTDPNLQPDANLKSTGARIWIWKATNEIIKENPIHGVGLGDTRDELSTKYKKMGIKSLEGSDLDSHQQFLQTFATLGLLGFLSLSLIFIVIIMTGWKQKNFLLLGIGLIYLLFGLTESMLETQAGVVFFTFFVFFFASTNNRLNNTSNE
ncbi:MAG: O-antigen ligase family protein [Flavobacteriales bacterium]|jgi:O-antigen ligase|nr:O-antigen ligase family protein [Flavobacteriales bacterium]